MSDNKDDDVIEIGFDEWLLIGYNARWITDMVCNTHDGLPMKDYEIEAFENGESPCIPIIRVWAHDNGRVEE